jgi:hypothetical protein
MTNASPTELTPEQLRKEQDLHERLTSPSAHLEASRDSPPAVTAEPKLLSPDELRAAQDLVERLQRDDYHSQ